MSCSALIHNAEIFGGEDSRGSQAAAGQKSSTQRELENTAKTQEKTDQRRNDSYAGQRCGVNLYGSCNMFSKEGRLLTRQECRFSS